jgi:hypothetical protein
MIAAPLPAWAAAPAIAAAPMHTVGAKAVYPRLTGFPDAKIMTRVNALLAAQEKTDRTAYADCLEQIKEQHQKSDKDTYSADIAVSYLSSRYLSVNVNSSYDCAGAYPSAGVETPLTFDLATGRLIDWNAMFKRGFLPSDSTADRASLSALTKLYRVRYSKDKADADCRGVIMSDDPFSSPPIVWLDAGKGLVVQPDFPHVTAACANPVSLSAADLAPYLKDATLLADLKAVVKPVVPRGHK